MDDHAISYKLLSRGTPVVTSDGEHLGSVERVLENAKEHIFDGIVIATPAGSRFVDAPEVGRITGRMVTLAINSVEAAGLPEPDGGIPEFQPNLGAGKLSRWFGGGWKKRG